MSGRSAQADELLGLPLSWGGSTLQAISILQQVTVPSGVSLDAALLDELRVSAGLMAGAMAGVSLDLAVVARISAGLSALVSLRMRLGIDPVQAGFAAVRARVAADFARVAAVAPWVAGTPTVMLGKMPMLDATSTCMCMWAGVVTIVSPGQMTTTIP